MTNIKSVIIVLLLFINTAAYSQSGWIKTNLGNRPLTGVHFLNSNTGFILSYDSLFKTTNGGLNWTGKGTGSGSPVFTSLKVFDENNIAIMGQCCYPEWSYGLISRTSNGGNNWTNSFLAPNQMILCAEKMEWFDINSGISIWVDYGGTNYYGRIFRTTNSGSNWILKNHNLETVNIRTLLTTNGFIFAGTLGNSVLKRSISEIIGIQNTGKDIPIAYSISQNYPNPFNPETRIRYSLPRSSIVSLVVYDALGRKIETLVDESQRAGTYEATFNASAIPSGVYFYRLTAEGFSETRKMVVIK